MNLAGEYRIAATRQVVWDALNNPDMLRTCIPGCQQLTLVTATDIDASVLAQLGPVKATFATRITLSDLNPPMSYTLSGEGKGGAAGFGRGEAKVVLIEEGNLTVLRYQADLKVGGKLAQIGSRLVEGTARKLADEFFGKFVTQLDQNAARTTPVAVTKAGESSGRRLAIAAAIALAVAALVWWLVS